MRGQGTDVSVPVCVGAAYGCGFGEGKGTQVG
jgi:hypothetical protein